MRLVARHLRRLESFGCIKQVKARPDIGLTTPFLFRCVKYIRDPEGTEWLPTRFPSKNRPKDAGAEEIEPCGLSDDEQCYEAQEARYFAVHGGNQDIHHLKEVERQVPQWRGDGALSNLLYDLVHASGQNGISTMVLWQKDSRWIKSLTCATGSEASLYGFFSSQAH